MGALDGYGLHELVWETADDVIGELFIASPADAGGRGIALTVKKGGQAANLSNANVYLAWRHREAHVRGTSEFVAVDASAGKFAVFYPSALACNEGTAYAQVVVTEGESSISTRVFTIHIEQNVIGGTETEDGFTLFIEAIQAYENAADISTAAADAANAAANAANQAAGAADDAREAIIAAAQNGDFDGADGQDGADGYSPTATVAQTDGGATITITDKNGTTTASVANGAKGDKGDKGDTGATGAQGPKGETGDTGATGPQGPKGDAGEAGADGSDGVSCTHAWNGTVLSITSASGTSSADLVGPQGPTGATGATGPAGADGTTFTPQSPLALSNGVLSIDLSDYAQADEAGAKLFYGFFVPKTDENGIGSQQISLSSYPGLKAGDLMLNLKADTLVQVTGVSQSGGSTYVSYQGVFQFPKLRGIIPTTDIDLAASVTGSASVDVKDHAVYAGTLLLNTTSTYVR